MQPTKTNLRSIQGAGEEKPEQPEPEKKGGGISFGVLALIVIGVAGYAWMKRRDEEKALEGKLAQADAEMSRLSQIQETRPYEYPASMRTNFY